MKYILKRFTMFKCKDKNEFIDENPVSQHKVYVFVHKTFESFISEMYTNFEFDSKMFMKIDKRNSKVIIIQISKQEPKSLYKKFYALEK